jgi:hypothetical protein
MVCFNEVFLIGATNAVMVDLLSSFPLLGLLRSVMDITEHNASTSLGHLHDFQSSPVYIIPLKKLRCFSSWLLAKEQYSSASIGALFKLLDTFCVYAFPLALM